MYMNIPRYEIIQTMIKDFVHVAQPYGKDADYAKQSQPASFRLSWLNLYGDELLVQVLYIVSLTQLRKPHKLENTEN